MNCSQCSHRNPIGNKFCRECGSALAPPQGPLAVEEAAVAERERLSERVAGLLGAAFTLAEQKRYAQALPIAEEAALLLPQSTAALSLMATLYEHTAQWDKAVTAMERVVALNPESPADRQKLESLRRGGAEKPVMGRPASARGDELPTSAGVANVARPALHWAPFVVGGAAAACVLAIGLSLLTSRHDRAGSLDRSGAIAGTNAPQPTSASPGANGTVAAEISSALPAANVTNGAAPNGAVTAASSTVPHESPPASETRADPFASTESNSSSAARTPARGGMGFSLPPLRTPSRRAYAPAGFSTGDSDVSTTPLPPILVTPPDRSNPNYGTTQSGFGSGTRIAVGPPTAAGSGAASTNAGSASVDSGYIHISVGPPVRAASGSRAASSGGASSDEAPMARARRLQSGGQYTEAIHSYQQSLNGANGGEVYEGIGQSYEGLGKVSAARDAYKQAIQSYQDARNTPTSQRGLAACKAALEALGEN